MFAGNFATFLTPDLAAQYLHVAIEVIESPSAGVPVKISAIKAVSKSVINLFMVHSAH